MPETGHPSGESGCSIEDAGCRARPSRVAGHLPLELQSGTPPLRNSLHSAETHRPSPRGNHADAPAAEEAGPLPLLPAACLSSCPHSSCPAVCRPTPPPPPNSPPPNRYPRTPPPRPPPSPPSSSSSPPASSLPWIWAWPLPPRASTRDHAPCSVPAAEPPTVRHRRSTCICASLCSSSSSVSSPCPRTSGRRACC